VSHVPLTVDIKTLESLSRPFQLSSSGRSYPIELVELSSPPNTANLSSLANEPPAIGLSVDPSQTQTLVIFPTDRRLSGVEGLLSSLRRATALPTGRAVMNGGADPFRLTASFRRI